jgi:hypothetical protein
MNENSIIIDNSFISIEKQSFIKNLLIDSGSFPWLLNLKTNDYLNKNKDTFQFTHPFFMNEEICSEYYPVVFELFNSFLIKHNIKCSKIIRAKANLTTKNENLESQEPHIDTNVPHKVFLYYVNTSDGDTIFYKDDIDLSMPVRRHEDLSIHEKVSPEIGKAINFNGLIYHSASNPKNNDLRAVINITYL